MGLAGIGPDLLRDASDLKQGGKKAKKRAGHRTKEVVSVGMGKNHREDIWGPES